MHYAAELQFLEKVLQTLHLTVRQISLVHDGTYQQIDLGLRKTLGLENDYLLAKNELLHLLKPNTIYIVSDEFLCQYVFLLLPGLPSPAALCIGPYLDVEITRKQLMENAEEYAIPPNQFRHIEMFYASLPVISDGTYMFAILITFGSVLWGDEEAFQIVDIEQPRSNKDAPVTPPVPSPHPEDTIFHMQMMEARYAHENELMNVVSKGMTHRAELMLTNFSQLSFEPRTTDSLRNQKNYCIICNTLLRKAAQNGGVHPVYLDKISSEYAKSIETLRNISECKEFMMKMLRGYCRLVRQHTTKSYSPLVQKAIAYIDSDLTVDLRLHVVADALKISASYLSTLFKKETGESYTEFVTNKRMDMASQLLRSTNLQVQTIAQHCGISDVNYFSKLFKRSYGVTPRVYRDKSQIN